MASRTRTRTGATVTATTGASTTSGAAGSDLQVWTLSRPAASEVCFWRLTRWDHPAGETQLSSLHPPRIIPRGCYDCGDGFYDPGTRKVTSYEGVFLRKAGQRENPNPTEGAGVVGGACGAFKRGKTGNGTN